MEYQEAIKRIKQGQIDPIYVLQGSESFLTTLLRRAIETQVEASQSELDLTVLDMTEVTMDQVLDEAETYSFFVDQRLIIVDYCDFLATQSQQKLSDAQEQRLFDYLKDPNPATCLVFIIPSDSVDKRRKLTKNLQKTVTYVNLEPLNEGQVLSYMKNYLQEIDLHLDQPLLEELLQRVNYKLSQAVTEVSKLQQYAFSGNPIDLTVVKSLVTRSLESNVFELTNALMQSQMAEAVQIYQDLVLMKHDPIQLHSLIVSQYRLIIQSKLLQSQGLNQASIAQVLGVHPYRVKLSLQMARRLSLKQLRNLYQDLITADYQMKTSQGQKETYFYLFLTKALRLVS